MPTYDYECQACGHRFELFQSMSAKVKRKCPECSKPKLERLIGPGAGFLFKGDGFYITDYRSDSYKAGQKAAEDSSKPSEKSSSDKSSADKTSSSNSGDSSQGSKGGGSTKKSGSSPASRKAKNSKKQA